MRIAIIGSAATRDALDHLPDDHEVVLTRYLARSSLASAMGTVPFDDVDLDGIETAFRRDIVEADLSGALRAVLEADDFDLLVYDPVDERFDVLERGDGARATLSGEFAATRYDTSAGIRVVSGTDDAFARWREAWTELVAMLVERAALHKLRVNAVRWATALEDGSPLPDRFSASRVAAANTYLDRIYAVVRETLPDAHVYSYADTELVAAVEHRWGIAPFHFVESYYARCAAHLAAEVPAQAPAWVRLLGDIDTQLADRRITTRSFVDLRTPGPTHVETGERAPIKLRSRGEVRRPGRFVSAEFVGGDDSYEFGVTLASSVPDGCGVAARLRLRGWREVRYVAVGYTGFEGAFVHLKSNHPRVDAWESVSWSTEDLVFLINHGFEPPVPGPIADVRVRVAGTPEHGGAAIDLAWVGGWAGTTTTTIDLVADEVRVDAWISGVLGYVGDANSFAGSQAVRHLESGGYPILEDLELDWPVGASQPVGLDATTTYQHRFHGHFATSALLVHAAEHDSRAALEAAAGWVASWLDHHARTTSPDLRYTWYDHAVGERLIAFDLLYVLGTRAGLDAAFLDRVRVAIEEHARLLESVLYYAHHQPYRYHNHAWFQDLALLVTAELFAGPQVARWHATAADRFADQLDHLFAVEGDYVVSVENSIGYHSSMGPLIGRFATLVPTLVEELGLDATREGIERFRELLRYPDGRLPAQGDTFRRVSGPVATLPAREKPSGLTVLDRSGYAVAEGGSGQGQFHLAVYATSLSATHKHADNLSFTLFHAGVEWFTDPSFYSHEYDEPVTAYVRGPWAHSQLLLPDAPYDRSPGLARLAGADHGEEFRITGSHRAQPGATVYRTLTGRWDRLHLAGEDRATVGPSVPLVLVFHLGEDVSADVVGGAFHLRHPGTPIVLELSISGGTAEAVSGWHGTAPSSSVIATTYQQVRDSTSVLVSSSGPLPLRWTVRPVQTG